MPGDRAFGLPGKRPFPLQPHFRMKEQVIDMPVRLSGLPRFQPPVPRNPLVYAPGCASDIGIAPRREAGSPERPDLECQRSRHFEVEYIRAAFSHPRITFAPSGREYPREQCAA